MALTLSMIAGCTMAFVLFVYFVLARHRSGGRSLFLLLLLLSISYEFFEFKTVAFPSEWPRWKYGALLVESFLPVCWLGYSYLFYREGKKRFALWQWLLFLPALGFFAVNALSPINSLFYSPDFSDEHVLFISRYGLAFYLSVVFYLTFALVNLEKTFFSYPRFERWQVKFEFVGVGAVLVSSLLYYSQALLYRSLDMSLVPLRSVGLLIGCVLILFSRVRRGGGHKIRLSREVTYRSMVAVAVGLYFLFLGLLGEGMRYLGGGSQKLIFGLIAFVLGLVLVTLLLSEGIRRKALVLLHKAFFSDKYDYRVHWKAFTDELGKVRSIEEVRSVILRTFCETFAMQAGALFWQSKGGGAFEFWDHYHLPWNHGNFAHDSALVGLLLDGERVLDVESAAGHLPYLREEGIAFVIPLVFEQRLKGMILLGRRINPGERMTYEDFDLMKMLARQAVASLLNWHLLEDVVAHKELAAMGKVSAFVLHDLKNQAASLALVAQNADEFIGDPDFQADMLDTIKSNVARMNQLISRLRNIHAQPLLCMENCDLLSLTLECIRSLKGADVVLEGEPVAVRCDRTEIQKVVLNLLLNAIEAGDGKQVRVLVGDTPQPSLSVHDMGSGMSQEFMAKRLFQPFETTKKNGLGIGLFQCRTIVEAHGGHIAVESQEGQGSCFTLWLPNA